MSTESKMDISVHLEDLRQSMGDTVPLEDIASVVSTLLGSLKGDITATDLALHNELQGLVDFIQQAHEEIRALRPTEIHDTHIPTAADELDAIVQSTEDAANKILAAAEQLEELSEEVGGDHGAKLTDIVMGIYEASTFQDLTGQRITKVVGALRHIELKVNELAKAVGHEVPEESYLNITDSVTALEEDDLLHGPSKLGETVSQDDIDALFG